jgi:hypothetical protein
LWSELLQWLQVDAIPLPLNGLRANAGDGESSKADSQLLADLRFQFAPTYEVLKKKYNLEWPTITLA